MTLAWLYGFSASQDEYLMKQRLRRKSRHDMSSAAARRPLPSAAAKPQCHRHGGFEASV